MRLRALRLTAIAHGILKAFGLPLDNLSAAAAYSLRKLRTAYTGPAIRVRRSHDNAETDIWFTAGGDLDTVALLAFVQHGGPGPGNQNGFITTWYDQSGNARNLTQATASFQPSIVNAGQVYTLNGLPIIAFDGVDETLVSTAIAAHLTGKNYTLIAAITTSTVDDNSSNSHYISLSGTGTAVRGYVFKSALGTLAFAFGASNPTVTTPVPDGTPIVVCAQKTSTTSVGARVNGVDLGAYATTFSGVYTHLSVGGFQGQTNNCANIKTGEIVFVDGSITEANRQLLERSQGAYYGITVA